MRSQVSVATFEKAQQAGVSEALLPVIGGALTGVAALVYPEVLYQGFTNVNTILQARNPKTLESEDCRACDGPPPPSRALSPIRCQLSFEARRAGESPPRVYVCARRSGSRIASSPELGLRTPMFSGGFVRCAQGGNDFTPSLLLQLVGVKIVMTALCKGSGLVGGIYAPSIFMGETRT